MFRKHLKFRRMVLGLAFAALVVPVAQATAANTDIKTYQPSYLRYHEAGVPAAPTADIRSENALRTSSVTPLQADGLRYTAMAQRYLSLQPSVVVSERSNGVKGPDPSLTPQLSLATSTGFDWTDAGVGASTTFGVAVLLGIAILFTRRRHPTGLTSA